MKADDEIVPKDHDRVGRQRDGEDTHEWIAHMTAERLRAYWAHLAQKTATTID